MMRLWGCLVVVVALGSCAPASPPRTSITVDEMHARQRAERARLDAERAQNRAGEVAAQDAERAKAQAARDAEYEEARARAATAAKARADYEESMRARAAAEGLADVLFSKGLFHVLERVIDGHATVDDGSGIAIELHGLDDGWIARQALEGGALYASQYSRATVWLEGATSTVIERSTLWTLCDFVEITGVRSYPTASGGTAQAMVARCAWPRD